MELANLTPNLTALSNSPFLKEGTPVPSGDKVLDALFEKVSALVDACSDKLPEEILSLWKDETQQKYAYTPTIRDRAQEIFVKISSQKPCLKKIQSICRRALASVHPDKVGKDWLETASKNWYNVLEFCEVFRFKGV